MRIISASPANVGGQAACSGRICMSGPCPQHRRTDCGSDFSRED